MFYNRADIMPESIYISENDPIIGYKAFDSDFKCQNFQYQPNMTYTTEGDISLHCWGFHFCEFPKNVTQFYSRNKNSTFAIVKAWGNVVRTSETSVASSIHILKQVSYETMMRDFKKRTAELTVFSFNDITMQIQNGKLQSGPDDSPAIYKEGYKRWYHRGKLHRDNDLPAIDNVDCRHSVILNFYKAWYIHGRLHREGDQPAVITRVKQEWYRDGKLHRDNDLPAIEYEHGTKEWWLHGKRHRDNNRPAIDGGGKKCEYWVHGKKINKTQTQTKYPFTARIVTYKLEDEGGILLLPDTLPPPENAVFVNRTDPITFENNKQYSTTISELMSG